MTTVVHAVGTRPNFVKMVSVVEALGQRDGFHQVVVHAGQHYDASLSDDVLADVRFPAPDHFLGVGSGTHAEQTARTLVAFERVLEQEEPDLVVVAGDVNATLACTLTAAKLGVAVAHVESGLRSRDWTMPEEVNRVLTDRLSDLLFTHSPEAEANLLGEGIEAGRIHFVGNTMIDTLRRFEAPARRLEAWTRFGAPAHEYVLVTLHRPSNVDDPERLGEIVGVLGKLAARSPVIFPVHPRTLAALTETHRLERLVASGVACVPALGYLDFLSLELGAGAVVTDSGGVQEETSALGVPCFTLRPNTERPVTLGEGTNTLLGDDPAAMLDVRPSGRAPEPRPIRLWDGRAGERIADLLARAYEPALVREAAAS